MQKGILVYKNHRLSTLRCPTCFECIRHSSSGA